MEARKREGRFRVAMREWETMLDVYLVDFVGGGGASAVPRPQPQPVQGPPPPAAPIPSPGRVRTPSVEDWKKYIGGGGLSRDLGGTVIFGVDDEEGSESQVRANRPRS